jgi:hemerythrin superfamily protein
MAEHASLRLRFRTMRESKNYDSIYEVEEFVRRCRARVEDEVVFPMLRDLLTSHMNEVLSRIEADHRLIEKIGDQIRLRTMEGDPSILLKRISLFFTTVESHNTSEETEIFSKIDLGRLDGKDVKEKIAKIIEEFGMNRYLEVTGYSQEFLALLR